MNPLYLLTFFAVFGAIMAFVSSVLKKKRGSNEKYQKIMSEFYNDVNKVLRPGEKIESYCGYVPCAAVTNMRLLVSDKNGITSVEFSQIRKVQGMSFSGNKTTDPNNMLALEIKADKKYVLGNHTDGFIQVVKDLNKHLKNS